MVEAGLVEEVRALAARPGGLSRTARQALGYREILAHVEGGVPLDDCLDEAVRRTRQFARRQASWFRRDPRIAWAAEPGRGLGAARAGPLGARLNGAAARMESVHASKHEGAGNDFLVVLDPDDTIGSRWPRSACWPTAAAASGRTGSSGSAPGATAATCPWSCATPTAARPR